MAENTGTDFYSLEQAEKDFSPEISVWDVYFAGIASIRFHPKNDHHHPPESEIEFAATIADLMMIERRKRCGQQQ